MSVAYAVESFTETLPPFKRTVRPPFLDFFAGSGLVSYALQPFFTSVWANDICSKKAAVFAANHAEGFFELGSVADVCGSALPSAALAWASFPCQDLSLAGKMEGIRAERSGLVWEWLRVIDEMPRRPQVLAVENVVGLVSSNGGEHYRELHAALVKRGYRVGALLLDAVLWLPQSRPRVFVVAADISMPIPPTLVADKPTWVHTDAIQKAAFGLPKWVWWKLPEPPKRVLTFSEIVDFSLPCHDAETSRRNLSMVSPEHKRLLEASSLRVVPGYKRMRQGVQMLELRFDDVAGCLRTPSGGSSRQYLVLRQDGEWRTRILSPKEAARLMGAPDDYQLPGGFNDGYRAMGDAVAVPVAAFLAHHLLAPLATVCYGDS